MNKMVFELQPEIIVNNRNGLQGDFSTPEQHIKPAKAGRAWETCMTLNDSWGFNRGDDGVEDAQDHRRQPRRMRARRRQLSAQHRPQARRIRSARVRQGA